MGSKLQCLKLGGLLQAYLRTVEFGKKYSSVIQFHVHTSIITLKLNSRFMQVLNEDSFQSQATCNIYLKGLGKIQYGHGHTDRVEVIQAINHLWFLFGGFRGGPGHADNANVTQTIATFSPACRSLVLPGFTGSRVHQAINNLHSQFSEWKNSLYISLCKTIICV